jgi:CysZ protein
MSEAKGKSMIEAAGLALRDIVSPPFRAVLIKSLAFAVALLAILWIALGRLFDYFVSLPYPWLDTAVEIASAVGLFIGLGFLIAPVTSLFAGLFLDDVAEVAERTHYPDEPPGRALPVFEAFAATAKFTAIVVLVNLVAFPMVFFLGFGVLIFLVANSYLLGREYFELAAQRFHPRETARRMRLRHSATVYAAGGLIAGFLAIPFVNLLTPLFATALMVHLHKRIAAGERRPGGLLAAP